MYCILCLPIQQSFCQVYWSKSNAIDVTSQAGEDTQFHYLENISICRICHRRPPWSGYIWVWVDVATLPSTSITFPQKSQKSKMMSSNLDQFLQLLHVSFPPGLSGTVRNKPELVFWRHFFAVSSFAPYSSSSIPFLQMYHFSTWLPKPILLYLMNFINFGPLQLFKN